MQRYEPSALGDLRMPWSRSERRVPRLIIRPLQDFLQTEASSGILLLIATVAALVWANLAHDSYESFWHTGISIGVGSWSFDGDLRHWINDAAMALFFFVVGLEIKRELVGGELRDPRVAALPVMAALGGMIVPASLYAVFNAGGAGSTGWGIPMATDIAFAVGVLAVVGRKVPSGLKLFLLTLAIVDDIGAILVIAIFYTASLSFLALLIAVGLLGSVLVLRRLNVRADFVYILIGIGVWFAVYQSGVHATIAGVAVAFVTPTVPFQRPHAVSREARRIADETSDDPAKMREDAPRWLRLATLSRDAVSPLVRMEDVLHPWTSYVIVPIFALANAGVAFDGLSFSDAEALRVAGGVVLGLVVGKTVGIALGAWIATKMGIARLPGGARWIQVVGVAALGGIGFTVSLFIAGLAFTDPAVLDASKVGILAGSFVAGVLGAVLLLRARASSA